MRKIIMLMFAMTALSGVANAQWAVFDPTNLTQSIINTSQNVAETSTTAKNMVKNFNETAKIYEQSRDYYETLRKVNTFVRDARKVQKTILLVGEIQDIYVKNFQYMMADNNYNVEELSAIAFGYTKIMEESLHLVKDLKDVTNSSTFKMNDKERMDIIDQIYSSMIRYRNLTEYYTRKTISVSYLRSKGTDDMARVRSLYGSQSSRYW